MAGRVERDAGKAMRKKQGSKSVDERTHDCDSFVRALRSSMSAARVSGVISGIKPTMVSTSSGVRLEERDDGGDGLDDKQASRKQRIITAAKIPIAIGTRITHGDPL